MAIVYQHRRKDTNEVFYIGISENISRAYQLGRNPHWNRIVNKHGYEVDILINGCTWEDACKVEKGMIESYGRSDLGLGTLVNMTNGGEGSNGYRWTEQQKTRARTLQIGKKYSYEVNKKKGKKSEEQLGEKNHMFGTMWINNGKINKYIKKGEPILKGFVVGRLVNWDNSIFENACLSTIWITNGIQSKRIKENDIIPNGWRKGRK